MAGGNEEFEDQTYGERYDWLAWLPDEPIPWKRFDTRARNSLRRARVRTWGDLAKFSDDRVRTLPHVGERTIQRINKTLRSYEQALPSELREAIFSETAVVEQVPPLPTALLPDRDLPATGEWTAALGLSTLGDVLARRDDGLPMPEEVAEELALFLAKSFSHSVSLTDLLEGLLGEAKHPGQLFDRECADNPPTLETLGQQRGVTRERIRQLVASDVLTVRAQLETARYRPVRWAVERFRAELGDVGRNTSEAVRAWQDRLGNRSFEFFRWLANYSHEDEWLVETSLTLPKVTRQLEGVVGDEWLVSSEALLHEQSIFLRREDVVAFLVATDRWRDIGDGWLVRWDGSIVDKAERVLRLTGEPKTAAELILLIGHGTEINLKNSYRSRLIRVDKHFRFAPADWGLEEYEGITIEIEQRIERGGGQASKTAIIDEFTRDFGVSVSSINTYLGLPIFEVAGDIVQLRDGVSFSPKPPSTISGSVRTSKGWGQRHVVTEDSLKGYSFSLSPHICWANGLKPKDDLIVPVNDSQSMEASLIWRITNLSGTVDVGRLRQWLEGEGGKLGSPVLICPTPDGVTVYLGDEEIEGARQTFAAEAPAIAPDIAALMENL